MNAAICLLGTLIPILLLGACATVTPYQPLQDGAGYSEQRIESNRYRINFAGNSKTPRETVQNYVLYRAAEITLANQYDYFTVAAQNTQAEAKNSGPSFGFGIGGIGIGSRGGLGVGIGTGTGSRAEYDASADVVLFRGQKPKDDQRSYDAREIKNNLEPKILRKPP